MATRKLGFSALLTAVYARLTTYELTKSYKFYNDVPMNAAKPYHVIGKPMGKKSDEFSNRDSQAEDNVFQIDSHVDEMGGRGDKAIADMMNNIMQGLTSSPLSIAGYYSPFILQIEYADVMKDTTEPGSYDRHGIMRFRVHMAPSS